MKFYLIQITNYYLLLTKYALHTLSFRRNYKPLNIYTHTHDIAPVARVTIFIQMLRSLVTQ